MLSKTKSSALVPLELPKAGRVNELEKNVNKSAEIPAAWKSRVGSPTLEGS